MKLFIIALLAISGSAFNLRESEMEGTSQIIDGTKATQGEFPYIIDLRKYDGHYCGGSIYNENWIITAAHCLSGDAYYYKTVAGELDFKTVSGKEQSRTVAKYILHENYESSTNKNDIALIKVDNPFVFNDNVNNIQLNKNFTESGDCTVAGWGSINGTHTTYPDDLYKVVIPVVDDDECNNVMGSKVTETNICAGHKEGGGSACYADSGGPLIVKDKTVENDKSDILTGIVSWGHFICGAANKYSVYVEIAHYIGWIEETITANV